LNETTKQFIRPSKLTTPFFIHIWSVWILKITSEVEMTFY